jgi:phosphoglycerol transferase MdoB-like AlkP superfamily enzyme
VDALLEVPTQAGDYRLQWDVVREGVRWLSEGTGADRESIPVEVRVGHAFSVVEWRPPRRLAPGSRVERRVLLRNDGTLTWRADGSFTVSYHWFSGTGEVVVWDGLRSQIPGAVEPGASVEVMAVIRAPGQSGRYQLQLDLVHEGVTWFSQRDPTLEARSTVLIAGIPGLGPAGWFFITLIVAAAAYLVARCGRPAVLLSWVAVADVAWCIGSVTVKQHGVLDAAGQHPTPDGWLVMGGGAAIVLLPVLLLPTRVRPWVVWTATVLATILLFTDVVYQRFFGDLVSVSLFGAASQVGRVRASVLSLVAARDLWLWLDLGAAYWLVRTVSRLPARSGSRSILVTAAMLSALVVGGVAGVYRLVAADTGVLQQVFRNVYLAREVGVLNYHAYDLARHVWRSTVRPGLDDADFRALVGFFSERAPQRAGSGPWFGAARGMNLVMVQVESLQGFVVDLEVNGRQVTPFLNRWVDEAAFFTNVTDQTAQGRSSDSELTTQVSMLPPVRGAAAFLFAGNDFTGIARMLGDRGYSTMSAVPFDGAFWNRRVTHQAFGYSRSLFADDLDSGEVIGWGLNDRAFLGQMAGRLTTLDRPFCTWLLTLSLHHPFAGFPEHHKLLDIAGWEGTPFGNFVHTMSFFDRALEDLVRSLEKEGLADDTVVVIWGDHDAGLEWEPSLARIAGQQPDEAGWYLSQRVPLLIRVPGGKGPRGEFDLPAGHQDVAPTVLALLGVDPGPMPFVGRNLLGKPGGGPIVGEYHCWQDRDHVYLKRGPSLADGECYRRETLQRVAETECAGGFEDAERQIEASRLVLEYDLQKRLAEELR